MGREEPYWEDIPEKERYFKRKRPLHPATDSRGGTGHSAKAATALIGLLDFLSDREASEDEVARFVASEYGCSDWAVRKAISAALGAKLAKRRHEPSIVFEIPRLFAAPVELGGHRACKIRLTPLGELWQASRPRAGDAEPVGADIGRELLAEGRRIARSLVPPGQAPPAAGISGEAELLAFVRGIVGKFRVRVEGKGGWRVSWEGKPGEVVPESKMQLIFLGMLEGYCEMAGLRLDPEVETGRGPGRFHRHGRPARPCAHRDEEAVEHRVLAGLRVQTPIYMQGQEVKRAIFLAVLDSDTPAQRKRWETLQEEASAVRAATGLGIEVECIDVLPKPSASEARIIDLRGRTP